MAAVELCRSSLPAWDAAFEGEQKTLNQDMACRMMKRKLATIIKHHNAIHNVMHLMAQSATLLAVSPKMQHHDITAEAIAVGQSTLKAAKTASVLCNGMDRLCQEGPYSAAQAGDFIAKHEAAYADIPRSFWAALEALSQHAAGVPSSAPSSSGSGSHKRAFEGEVESPRSEASVGAAVLRAQAADATTRAPLPLNCRNAHLA